MSRCLGRHRGSHAVFLALLSAFVAPAVQAADGEPKTKPPIVIDESTTSDEEQAALDFAREHHPELSKLLGPMKKAHPKEYQKAIRELSRVSDRLVRMKTKFPERYAIELDLWKAESRLRLVAARSAMLDDDERREQIETLVTQRNQLKMQLLDFEKSEAESRIAQLEKQIAALKSQQAQGARVEVDRLVNSAKSSAKRVKTKLDRSADDARPAEKAKDGNSKRAPAEAGASQKSNTQ